MTLAAIKAVLRNYKPLVSRPYMQLILEVPEEEAQNVISTLGWPIAGESKWVAVALLADEPPTVQETETTKTIDDLPNYLRTDYQTRN